MFNRILSAFIITFVLCVTGPAQSAQISESGKQFNACTSSSDKEVTISEDGSSSMCCSKKLGYCMSCSHLSCVKVAYSAPHPALQYLQPHIVSGNAIVQPKPKPPGLRHIIKRPPAIMSAPTKSTGADKVTNNK